ncbi:hypothetical protein HDU97_009569 [Phlyctochytrium planicorne]|nr:hypothetical protein HDU97_009569 [Phlyctochytrium planicorne]
MSKKQRWRTSTGNTFENLNRNLPHGIIDNSQKRYPALHNVKLPSLQQVVVKERPAALVPNNIKPDRWARQVPLKTNDFSISTLEKVNVRSGMLMSKVRDADVFAEDLMLYANLHKEMSSSFSVVSLKFGAEGQLLQLPSDVAFHSSTIKHIKKSCGNFLENDHQTISFPSICVEAMQEIILYLFALWLDSVDAWKTKPNFSFLSAKQFFPSVSASLLTLEASVYLDLPELADKCSIVISNNFRELESLDNLPAPILKILIKRLNALELRIVEMYHSIEEKVRTLSSWVDKFVDVLNSDAEEAAAGALCYSNQEEAMKELRTLCLGKILNELVIHDYETDQSLIALSELTELKIEGSWIENSFGNISPADFLIRLPKVQSIEIRLRSRLGRHTLGEIKRLLALFGGSISISIYMADDGRENVISAIRIVEETLAEPFASPQIHQTSQNSQLKEKEGRKEIRNNELPKIQSSQDLKLQIFHAKDGLDSSSSICRFNSRLSRWDDA